MASHGPFLPAKAARGAGAAGERWLMLSMELEKRAQPRGVRPHTWGAALDTDESGGVLPLVAVAFLVLALAAGLLLEYGRMVLYRTQFQAFC